MILTSLSSRIIMAMPIRVIYRSGDILREVMRKNAT
jgi:hypothetical protein